MSLPFLESLIFFFFMLNAFYRYFSLQEHVDPNFTPIVPRLYQVRLGMGYLELPQVEVPHGKLSNNLLNNRNVYILDCYLDVYVW